jgi:hypothetical protein
MNKENSKVQSVVESFFSALIDSLVSKNTFRIISNLYVQLDSENGEIQAYDEQGNLLKKIVVFEWVDVEKEAETFGSEAVDVIKGAIASLDDKGAFDHPVFVRPFAISWTDEDFNILAPIYTIEDEIVLSANSFLKKIDAELDDFFEKLLLDVE